MRVLDVVKEPLDIIKWNRHSEREEEAKKVLQNDEGFAMLYITHDLHLARKVANKVYVMHEGRFVESGASFEVFDNPEYDYTRKLMKEAFEDPV
jgi:peptide/nickel transport system ATP-binding protein